MADDPREVEEITQKELNQKELNKKELKEQYAKRAVTGGVYKITCKETEQKFELIANAIADTHRAIDLLSSTTLELNSNKERVLGLMENLSAIAEENAAGTQEASASIEEQSATVEEIANSSENLSMIATELKVMVQKFKL